MIGSVGLLVQNAHSVPRSIRTVAQGFYSSERMPLAFLKCIVPLVVSCAALASVATAEDRRSLPKIGELRVASEAQNTHWREPYIKEMHALGWIEGQTAQFIVRYADGDVTRLPALAQGLVELGVDVLVVGDGALPAARQATTKIPIVCLDMYDPIAEGVAADLARPKGNVTGVSWQSVDSAAKRLELTKELIPGLSRVVLLTMAGDLGAAMETKGLRATAAKAGVHLRVFEVHNPGEFAAAFAMIVSYRPQALIVSVNPLTVRQLPEIVAFAARNRLPGISEAAQFADAGFVLTYGPDMADAYRRGAAQVDKVLRGKKPAELPFEQPMQFDLVINMKTAKNLGLTIPESIALRATRIIR